MASIAFCQLLGGSPLLQGVDDRSATVASSVPVLSNFGRQDLFWRDDSEAQGFWEGFGVNDDHKARLRASSLP
jgi:hypothetical protein